MRKSKKLAILKMLKEKEEAAAAEVARQNGVRVVHPRTGLVVSSAGGAWG